ncbi:MAG: hypothetical protein ACR2QK_19185, partial [Acidimicrobiales bacterium]
MPPAGPRGGSGLNLPPLNQPTGEHPKIHPDEAAPDDTVVVTGDPASDGVFSARGPQPDSSRFDSPMPSALPAADEPCAVASDATGVMPGFDEQAGEAGWSAVGSDLGAVGAPADVDDDIAAVESQLAMARDNAPTNPFSDPPPPGQFADASAPRGRADAGRPLAMGVSAAASRQGGRSMAGSAPLDAPTDLGQPPRSGRPDRRFEADQADRLQDTEFKLADKRRKPKPKEPNRLILGLAMGLVLL